MSLLLRTLLRDPLVTRPLSRAIRRFDNNLWVDDWPVARVRRLAPATYESSLGLMEDMSRQMANTMNRMQEMMEDMETLDDWASRLEPPAKRPRDVDATVKRTESGGLQLTLDMADYKPEDLKIKLVDDHLVIEADSEQAGEDSYKRSHFKRWFKVPEDCKLEEIRSKLTEDSKLLIDLPMNKPIESKEKTIPIEVERREAVTNQGGNNRRENHHQHQEDQPQVKHTASG